MFRKKVFIRVSAYFFWKDVGAVHLNTVIWRGTEMFVILCLVFSILFISTISAEDTPENVVDATFTVAFITGTNLKINAVFLVNGVKRP